MLFATIVQFLILFVFSILTVQLAKKRTFKILLSLLASIFINLQISSLYFGGSFIDYKFYMHSLLRNEDLLSEFFLIPVLLFCGSTALFTFLLFWLSQFADRKINISGGIRITIIVLALVGMSFKGGIINSIFHIVKIISAPDKNLLESMQALNIEGEDYTFPDQVKATPGKNLIVIVLESMEKGLLEDSFSHLTPNLRQLSQDWTYMEMNQIEGGAWTSGSLYTMMTGIPAFFRAPGNNKFLGSSGSKLSTMPLVLDSAGYQLKYLLAAPEFNGLRDMLTALGFEVRSESEFDQKYEEVSWAGMHDYDLVEEVKKELLLLNKSSQPFALFTSTISTHFPEGVYDARFEKILEFQGSEIETMIAATDYLTGDLISFLKDEDMLDSTAVVIIPDHIWMGYNARIVNKLPKERGLYFLSNIPKEEFSYYNDASIFQFDLPKLILEAAGVQHNVKFLMEYQKREEAKDFSEKNSDKILSLNEASFLRIHGIEMKRVKRKLKRDFIEYE